MSELAHEDETTGKNMKSMLDDDRSLMTADIRGREISRNEESATLKLLVVS